MFFRASQSMLWDEEGPGAPGWWGPGRRGPLGLVEFAESQGPSGLNCPVKSGEESATGVEGLPSLASK